MAPLKKLEFDVRPAEDWFDAGPPGCRPRAGGPCRRTQSYWHYAAACQGRSLGRPHGLAGLPVWISNLNWPGKPPARGARARKALAERPQSPAARATVTGSELAIPGRRRVMVYQDAGGSECDLESARAAGGSLRLWPRGLEFWRPPAGRGRQARPPPPVPARARLRGRQMSSWPGTVSLAELGSAPATGRSLVVVTGGEGPSERNLKRRRPGRGPAGDTGPLP